VPAIALHPATLRAGVVEGCGILPRAFIFWHVPSDWSDMRARPHLEARPQEEKSAEEKRPRHDQPPGRQRRWGRVLLISLLGIIAALFLIGLVASPIAKSVVNRKLASLPEHRGRVETVNVALWRGAGEIKDLVLYERAEESEQKPAVRVKRATFWIDYRSLFKGTLAGRAVVETAEVNIIRRDSRASVKDVAEEVKREVKEAKDAAEPWRQAIRDAFPMEISRFELKESKIRFVDRTHQPNVDVGIENLNIVATDLRSRPKPGEDLPAKVNLEGVLTGNGKLKLTARADPLAETPRFVSTLEIRELQLPPFNTFLRAYAGVDVASGTFEFYSEAEGRDGGYSGYVKPFLKDVDFKTAADKDKGVIQKVKESVADVITSVMKNDEAEKVATKAPFSGRFDQNDVDVWTAIENLFRNAFVQALREGFDGRGGGAKAPQ
jgi:hypothetical protein